MSFTYPTFLTCIRLLLIPLIARALIDQSLSGALVLFVIAVVTDLLDGFLARKWQQESVLGAMLDPLADKLLIITSYLMLMGPTFYGVLPHWFVWTVIIKEAALVLGAFYLCVLKKQLPLKPLVGGKISMVVQSLFAITLLGCMIFGWNPARYLPFLMGLVLFFVGGSLVQYAYQLLKKG